MANILYQTQEELIDSPPISREELLTKNPELKLFLDDKKETPNTLEGIEETLVELANQEGFDEHLFIHSFILIEKFIVDSQIGGKIHFPRLITCVFFITQKFCFEDEIFYVVPMSEIGQIKVKSLTDGEQIVLKVLNFRVHILDEEKAYCKQNVLEDPLNTFD